MTLAFIIAAVIAGILFFLWISERDKLKENEGKLHQLTSSGYAHQTLLTPELMQDVVRRNGFIPLQSEDKEWIPFKWQGEVYFISTNSLPCIQFYKGFSYKDDNDIELLKKSAEMTMEELWYGRITFSEEEDVMAFRTFAVEKSVEHFTDSFMDYMKMLENMISCHRHFYQQLVQEENTIRLNESKLPNLDKKHGTVS